MYKDALIKELLNALQALYSVQNDAPLERYRKEWEEAMAKARSVLSFAAIFWDNPEDAS